MLPRNLGGKKQLVILKIQSASFCINACISNLKNEVIAKDI